MADNPVTKDALPLEGIAIASLAPQNEQRASSPGATYGIQSTMRPVLPFTPDPSDLGLIGEVAVNAPPWMRRGLRIVSVNGTRIETLDQVSVILLDGLRQDVAKVDVSVGVIERIDQPPVDRILTIPVLHDLLLPNGFGFRTSLEDGGWVTRVTAAPDEGDLVEGDVVIGLVRNGERIDGPNVLAQLIEAELAEGRTSFAFAVSRKGFIWVETLTFPSL